MVEPMVRMRGLYKIFGARGKGVLHHVQGGMGKEELLARHGHVLGLNNINVDMQVGDITVVMGLSGSGKSTLIRHLNRLIEPTVGEIIVRGEDVMSLSADGLRKARQEKMSKKNPKTGPSWPGKSVPRGWTNASRGHILTLRWSDVLSECNLFCSFYIFSDLENVPIWHNI